MGKMQGFLPYQFTDSKSGFSSVQKYLPILLLLLFCALVLIGTAFEPAIADDADAIHAVAAKEILQRHDWVTLYVNGVRYLQKAPLLYWLVAFSYQIFGFSAFAERLPMLLAVVLLVGVTYMLGRWSYGSRTGFYAASIMGLSIGTFLFTRIMIPETLLTLLLTIGHFCFLLAFCSSSQPRRLHSRFFDQGFFYYGFYGAAALAVLTKGLIGIIFAVVPAFLFLLLTGNFSRWRELRLLSGLGVFLAIAAPWHILAGLQNDHFFWYYFVNEHFLRFLGERYPKDYNKLPFLQYWLLHLIWLFPWSLGLPLLVKPLLNFRAMRQRQVEVSDAAADRRSPAQQTEMTQAEKIQTETSSQAPKRLKFLPDSVSRLLPVLPLLPKISLYLWLWAGTILIFFNLSTSQEYYTYPAYPALALLLAAALARAEKTLQGQQYLQWMNRILAAIAFLTASILGFLVWQSRRIRETGDFSTLLNQRATESEKYTFFLGHALDLTPQAFAELEAPAIAAAFVLAIGFLLALGLRLRHRHALATIAMATTMGLLFICAHSAQIKFEPILSSRFMANEILQRWQPDAKIVLNGSFEVGGSIAFYTNQRVLLLNGRTLVMEFGSHYPDVPPIFIDDAEIRRLWQSGDRVFLFTEVAKKQGLLQSLALPVIPVIEKGGKALFINR